MPSTVMVGLKPEVETQPLIDLTTSVTDAGATIHLVELIRVPTGDDEGPDIDGERRRVGQFADRLAAAGYNVQTHVEVFTAAAGAELVRLANRIGADLIVIGLAKRSRVGKALLGSDAQRVLLSADCPVLSARLD